MRTCPKYIVALLRDIEHKLEVAQENVTQKPYDSPFQNTGNIFKTDVFEVYAYYWGDDERLINKPNFKCGDLEISWYKHLGRGTAINKRISRRKMEKIYLKCLISIEAWEDEYSPDDMGFKLKDYGWEKREYKYLKGYESYKANFFLRLYRRIVNRRRRDEES